MSPLRSIIFLVDSLVVLLFQAFSLLEAQQQLSGKYPRALFFRSSSKPSGDFPMSHRKLSKLLQRGQTTIPLPPYRGKLGCFVFVQRAHMFLHASFSLFRLLILAPLLFAQLCHSTYRLFLSLSQSKASHAPL